MKTYDITPEGSMAVLVNRKDNIQIITFGMHSKSLEGRIRGIKPNDNAFFTTNIDFKDNSVELIMGVN